VRVRWTWFIPKVTKLTLDGFFVDNKELKSILILKHVETKNTKYSRNLLHKILTILRIQLYFQEAFHKQWVRKEQNNTNQIFNLKQVYLKIDIDKYSNTTQLVTKINCAFLINNFHLIHSVNITYHSISQIWYIAVTWDEQPRPDIRIYSSFVLITH
jgi:hypothetical protein